MSRRGNASVQFPSPERLAIVGDIHANWPAFDAVLGAVAATGIDAGIVMGDVVMRGAAPGRCIDRIVELGWPAVAGNTDLRVVAEAPRPVTHRASSRVGSRSWTRRALNDAQAAFLAALPLSCVVELGRFRVMAMHASPHDPSLTVVDAFSSDKTLGRLAEDLGVDAIVTGHTHVPLTRHVDGCLFVNAGSVGESPDSDDLRPRWAWLEVADDRLVAHLASVDSPLATLRSP